MDMENTNEKTDKEIVLNHRSQSVIQHYIIPAQKVRSYIKIKDLAIVC